MLLLAVWVTGPVSFQSTFVAVLLMMYLGRAGKTKIRSVVYFTATCLSSADVGGRGQKPKGIGRFTPTSARIHLVWIPLKLNKRWAHQRTQQHIRICPTEAPGPQVFF